MLIAAVPKAAENQSRITTLEVTAFVSGR